MIVNGANAYIQSAVASAAQLNPAERQNTADQRVRENTPQPKQAETADTQLLAGSENREEIRQNTATQRRDEEFNNFDSVEADDGQGFEAFLQESGLSADAPRGSVVNLST